MAIVLNVSETMFLETFRSMGRQEQFSYDAMRALYAYLEDMSDDIGQDVELDVVALCCEYTQESFDDVADNYSIDTSYAVDEDDRIELILQHLDENTSVIWHDGETVLFQVF